MLIRAGYDIGFATEHAVPTLANLSVHPSRNKDLRTAQRIMTTPTCRCTIISIASATSARG